jgi:chemotaxis protein histidine kinase CheA
MCTEFEKGAVEQPRLPQSLIAWGQEAPVDIPATAVNRIAAERTALRRQAKSLEESLHATRERLYDAERENASLQRELKNSKTHVGYLEDRLQRVSGIAESAKAELQRTLKYSKTQEESLEALMQQQKADAERANATLQDERDALMKRAESLQAALLQAKDAADRANVTMQSEREASMMKAEAQEKAHAAEVQKIREAAESETASLRGLLADSRKQAVLRQAEMEAARKAASDDRATEDALRSQIKDLEARLQDALREVQEERSKNLLGNANALQVSDTEHMAGVMAAPPQQEPEEKQSVTPMEALVPDRLRTIQGPNPYREDQFEEVGEKMSNFTGLLCKCSTWWLALPQLPASTDGKPDTKVVEVRIKLREILQAWPTWVHKYNNRLEPHIQQLQLAPILHRFEQANFTSAPVNGGLPMMISQLSKMVAIWPWATPAKKPLIPYDLPTRYHPTEDLISAAKRAAMAIEDPEPITMEGSAPGAAGPSQPRRTVRPRQRRNVNARNRPSGRTSQPSANPEQDRAITDLMRSAKRLRIQEELEE